MNYQKIKTIATYLRYWSLRMSTKAGSGHPTSSLSAADLMAALIATTFRYDLKNPDNPGNDRLIFSKGHASPLYYSLFAVMGAIPIKELDNYRKFTSNLEGHPTPRFPYTEAATGSLGQGLSIGVGEALAIRAQISNFKFQISNEKKQRTKNQELRTNFRDPLVFVLLGDGEMAEGSTWEAIEIASKYNLNNLIAILDVNKLGQSDETMLGYDLAVYQKRISSFGWATKVIDGHDYEQINAAMRQCNNVPMKDKPFMIIAKTIKGKGVSFLEGKNGWHGKPIPPEQLEKALSLLGPVNLKLRVEVAKPARREISNFKFQISNKNSKSKDSKLNYDIGDQVATRKAYGEALARLGEKYTNVVSLDGDVKNSTYSEIFKEKFPERFFEMYIAEQNMVGAAVGMAKRGFIPFVSTFSAFMTRAYDQIRMAAISSANINFCGSHAGVSIGEDGPSQMGLEDIAMFRTIYGSTVLYPADAVATEKLVEEMIKEPHIAYIRTSRPPTPVIYSADEKFVIGGSKIHKVKSQKLKVKSTSKNSKVLIIAAGVTLFEALKAQNELIKVKVEAIVVDCYSVKPLDGATIRRLAKETGRVVTVEDHWYEGGLGDAVLNELINEPINIKFAKLAVCKMPRSGKTEELLDWEGISAKTIVEKAKSILLK